MEYDIFQSKIKFLFENKLPLKLIMRFVVQKRRKILSQLILPKNHIIQDVDNITQQDYLQEF